MLLTNQTCFTSNRRCLDTRSFLCGGRFQVSIIQLPRQAICWNHATTKSDKANTGIIHEQRVLIGWAVISIEARIFIFVFYYDVFVLCRKFRINCVVSLEYLIQIGF